MLKRETKNAFESKQQIQEEVDCYNYNKLATPQLAYKSHCKRQIERCCCGP